MTSTSWRLRVPILLLLSLALAVGLLLAPGNTPAASASIQTTTAAQSVSQVASVRHRPKRWWAERWAMYRAGCRYAWGGKSCYPGFDCSGLVQAAYHHVGIWLPRTTYQTLKYWRLRRIPIRDAKRGDLLFYGSGHVELMTTHWHTSFGAHTWGWPVGWYHWNRWWHPTMAFRVRGAG